VRFVSIGQSSERSAARAKRRGESVAAFSTLGGPNQLGSGATAGPCGSALVDLSALGPTWLVGWSSGWMESHRYPSRQCWTCDHRVGARSAFRLCGARLGARDDAELLAGAWTVPLHAQPDVCGGYRDMVRLDRVLWERRSLCGTRGHLDRTVWKSDGERPTASTGGRCRAGSAAGLFDTAVAHKPDCCGLKLAELMANKISAGMFATFPSNAWPVQGIPRRLGLERVSGVRIPLPPPTSLSLIGYFRELSESAACAELLPKVVDR
jgi:hypothetical protein